MPVEQRVIYQNQELIRRLLDETRTIAIVGLSPDRQKASHFVATYLAYAGYDIIPINPLYDEVLGRKSYASLERVPVAIDMVDVFRPAPECVQIARDAAAVGARSLWLQLRIINLEAGEIAKAAGLGIVMDRCIKMEHGRYNGTMHWVGMNTGIISARKRASPRFT